MAQAMATLDSNGLRVEEACPELPICTMLISAFAVCIMWRSMHLPDSVQQYFKQTLQENIAVGQAQTSRDILGWRLSGC